MEKNPKIIFRHDNCMITSNDAVRVLVRVPTFLVQRRPLQLYVTSDHYNSFKKFD